MTRSDRPTLPGDDPFSPQTERRLAIAAPAQHVLDVRSIPWVIASFAEVRRLPLDPRSAFVLSLIDGRADVATIIDMSAMPPDEVIAIFGELVVRGVVEMHSP